MTTTAGIIDNFVMGDTFDTTHSITVPSGVLIDTAWFMVKRSYADIDSAAIISKTLLSGAVQDRGMSGTGSVTFSLTSEETAVLTAYSEYPYSVKVKYTDDTIKTAELGKISAYPWVKQGNT